MAGHYVAKNAKERGRAGYFRTHVPRMARAVFCHVEMPRTEERIALGELEAHTVYLVRLESHLGKYPSPDTWFGLRYSRFQHLHQKLRETQPTPRLPELPRSRPR